ncbi:CcmD family protein [Evansella caseinilytica]|uniref:CcmD family protein n=1 Tax=Evansella caseinilytica TaxID=1503961 RepID=A0A1H3UZC1_9BACI|nr:CcmD family protein [Evansella caseinilytica]SDZ67125.1 CcmD family protein [Evansella caseinilytica]
MGYLFAAYTIIWVLLAGYLLFLGKRQKQAIKQIKFLQDLQDR